MSPTIHTPMTLAPQGRIAIVGYGGVTPLGTAETTFLTRTGRFDQALPEFARLMGLVKGTDQPSPADLERHRQFIDEHIGIRVIRPEDTEEGIDPQRFRRLFQVDEDTWKARMVKLSCCHAGVLPAGWDLMAETGLKGEPFSSMGRAHLMMVRALTEALVRTGVPWEEIAGKITPNERAVAAAVGLGPGKFLREGMIGFAMGRELATDILARYIPDWMAFLLGKILDARHASTRLGACDTGICNTEDLLAHMRAKRLLFGAVATFESDLNETGIEAFTAQKALAGDRSVASLKDHPSLVSRPGLADRYGFVMGEGGGILLLMEMETALELGAVIYGELLASETAIGAKGSWDSAAPTDGVVLAMERSLQTAAQLDGVEPGEVVQALTVINGHGTSTPRGDENGTVCYDRVLDRYGRDPKRPVVVTYAKGGPLMEGTPSAREAGAIGTGHLLGGAALAATVETVQMHADGIVPPAVSGLGGVDPNIVGARHLVYMTEPVWMEVEVAATEAEGFGDNNGVTLTRQYRPGRYRGGGEALGRQRERAAWRDEQLTAMREGKAKPANFLPGMTGK